MASTGPSIVVYPSASSCIVGYRHCCAVGQIVIDLQFEQLCIELGCFVASADCLSDDFQRHVSFIWFYS